MEGLTQIRKELIESAIKLLLDCDDYEGLNFKEYDTTQEIVEIPSKEFELLHKLSRIGSLFVLSILESEQK
jgi:hypothetical protein